MFSLNDKLIREALLKRLSNFAVSPRAVIQELRVHNGNAIADVVTVHSYAHCYEIKGDTDNINRINKQSLYYDLAFRKTTLVTTEKQLSRALTIAPNHWGVICAKFGDNDIVFKYIRGAKISPKFDKQLALLTLWRPELLDVARGLDGLNQKLDKLNRSQLSAIISTKLNEENLSREIGDKLTNRAS